MNPDTQTGSDLYRKTDTDPTKTPESGFATLVAGALLKFIGDLHSGKLHREYHYGPDEAEEQEEQQQQQQGDGQGDEGKICIT